jgi:hypothetical protein
MLRYCTLSERCRTCNVFCGGDGGNDGAMRTQLEAIVYVLFIFLNLMYSIFCSYLERRREFDVRDYSSCDLALVVPNWLRLNEEGMITRRSGRVVAPVLVG